MCRSNIHSKTLLSRSTFKRTEIGQNGKDHSQTSKKDRSLFDEVHNMFVRARVNSRGSNCLPSTSTSIPIRFLLLLPNNIIVNEDSP